MKKIQFSNLSAMWRFLETSKIQSYNADQSRAVATVYGAEEWQLERAVNEYQATIIQ